MLDPRPGQLVRFHYARKWWRNAIYHERHGVVVVVWNGRGPRNVGVRLREGTLVCVPRGHLVEYDPDWKLKRKQQQLF